MIKKNQKIKSFNLLFPIAMAIAGIFLLFIVVDDTIFPKLLLLMTVYFIPPLGKETVIPLAVAGGQFSFPWSSELIIVPKIDPLTIALSIAFVDICIALFLALNYDYAKGIPAVGTFMKKVEKLGSDSSGKYKWLMPLRFFGIALFVMVPFQGSGGLVGSILGRLIGMKPWDVFAAISVGTVSGCLLIAYFAETMIELFSNNIVLGLFIIIVMIIIGTIVYTHGKSKKVKG